MEKHNRKSIFVVGDVMLDSYFNGSVDRISPEAPVPVLHHRETINKLGGAGNVANNLAQSGCSVHLFGLIGNDTNGSVIRSLLEKSGFESNLLEVASGKTINKLRIVSQGQQIVRVDFEDDFYKVNAEQLTQLVTEQLKTCSLLILSDYGKGTLSDIEALIRQANSYGIPVLIDPKGSNFDKYSNATILKPNKSEFELIVGEWDGIDQFFLKGEALRTQLNLDALLVTLSEDGMVLFEENAEPLSIPAEAHDIVDVTGAGDTVLSWLAMGMASGMSMADSAIRANVASSIAVSKFGATAVSQAEVSMAENFSQRRSSRTTVKDFVSACRSRAETIVFTNGCFDILHEGHVNLLEEAKGLGDKLVVGVNDDASVKRLKGDSRPINSLASRIKVLEALSSVDFAISFSEETPISLIKEICPDILVKGGDYLNQEIVGSDFVTERGGKVHILDFLDGFSSSHIIDAVKRSQT